MKVERRSGIRSHCDLSTSPVKHQHGFFMPVLDPFGFFHNIIWNTLVCIDQNVQQGRKRGNEVGSF